MSPSIFCCWGKVIQWRVGILSLYTHCLSPGKWVFSSKNKSTQEKWRFETIFGTTKHCKCVCVCVCGLRTHRLSDTVHPLPPPSLTWPYGGHLWRWVSSRVPNNLPLLSWGYFGEGKTQQKHFGVQMGQCYRFTNNLHGQWEERSPPQFLLSPHLWAIPLWM